MRVFVFRCIGVSGKLYAAKTETLATATAVTNINTNFFIKKLLPFYTNQLLYTHFVLHSLIHITIYLYSDFVKPKRTTIFLDAKMIQKSAFRMILYFFLTV